MRAARTLLIIFGLAVAASLSTAGWHAGLAQTARKQLIMAVPGIPPIFASVLVYVAEGEGFFRKFGAEVEVRPFDTGTAAARAATAGDIDIAISPSPLIINQISNADVNLVAIHGFPNPDWILASIDPSKTTCQDIVGQPVGVDAVGGARSIALRTMLSGCPGVKIEQVQQVALSSNTAPAMIAGRLAFGVLHLDDVAVLEAQGKQVKTLLRQKDTNPDSHYLLTVARMDRVKENREPYVKALAGLIAAGRYMREPKNADRVAEIASPTGHNKEIAKKALQEFLSFGFWAIDDDGLDRKKLEAVAATQARVGGIMAGKQPVGYERLVDQSIWRDAKQLADKP